MVDSVSCFEIEGYYAYVHSGAGSFFDDAILQSPNMTKTGAGCVVRFYYHMYTASSSGFTGTLYLKLKNKGGTATLYEVWNNRGNKWNRAEVGLGVVDKGTSLDFFRVIENCFQKHVSNKMCKRVGKKSKKWLSTWKNRPFYII